MNWTQMMYDGTSRSDQGSSKGAQGRQVPGGALLQRAMGTVRLSARVIDRETRIDDMYQSGCAKVRLPRTYDGNGFEAVLLNTAGGLTGGDEIRTEITAQSGSSVTVSSQACERVYRAMDGNAQMTTELCIDAGASLHWLPQETILFDGGRIDRRLTVDMAEDASFLAVEPLVLGRVASDEILGTGLFRDSWRVRQGGRLLFADETRLDGDLGRIASGPATLADNKAAATLLFVSPNSEKLVDPARALLADAQAGVSAMDGMLLCRMVALDSYELRAHLIPLLTLLRGGTALPRVWHL